MFIYLLPELPEPEWEAELKVFMLVSGGTSWMSVFKSLKAENHREQRGEKKTNKKKLFWGRIIIFLWERMVRSNLR